MASEPSPSHLILSSSRVRDDSMLRVRSVTPSALGSLEVPLSSRARLGRQYTSLSLSERSGAVYKPSTALLGDGPSSFSHVGADFDRLRSEAYHGFTTKHGDRSGLINKTPLAEPSTLSLLSGGSTYDYHCDEARFKTRNVLARDGSSDASDAY